MATSKKASGAAAKEPEATTTTSSEVPAKADAKEAPAAWVSSIPQKRPALVFPPFSELTKLIYGEPKVGKTSFLDKAPGHFFMATEPGHDFVKSPVVRIIHWGWDKEGSKYIVAQGDRYIPPRYDEKTGVTYTNLKDLVRELHANKGKDGSFKIITIDIIDNLWGMCLDAVCTMLGLDYPPEHDFGKTWKLVRSDWEMWLRRLMDVASVNFVTHTTTDTVDIKMKGITKEVVRRIPTFKGNKAAQFLDGIVNVMGFAHFGEDGSRQITFGGQTNLATGDRTGIFEKLGPLPLDWAEVEAAYNKQAKAMGIEIRSKWS